MSCLLSARREGDVVIDEPGPYSPVGMITAPRCSFPETVIQECGSIVWY